MSPTDTDGLLRAAGGPRPKDDLVERLRIRATADIAHGWDGDARDRDEAATEILRLRERVAELHDNGQRLLEAADSWKESAQRAESSETEARAKIAEQLIEIGQLQDRLEGYFKRLTRMDGLLANAEAERDTQNRALAQCRALLKQEIDDVVPLRERVAALRAENAQLKDKEMGALARCGQLLLTAEAERDLLLDEIEALNLPVPFGPQNGKTWHEAVQESIDALRADAERLRARIADLEHWQDSAMAVIEAAKVRAVNYDELGRAFDAALAKLERSE